jgi:hypothetical protein
MERNENPYASPTAPLELVPSNAPRIVGVGFNVAVGCVIGAIAFVVALMLTPSASTSIPQFDRQLSQRLGVVLSIAIGFWVAWVRQSRVWAFAGPVVGLALGVTYWSLVTSDVAVAVFLLPIVLGAIASYFLGMRKNDKSSSVRRLFLGALSGAVLGFAYINFLGIFDFIEGLEFKQPVEQYIIEKWKIGPPAFAIACGLFFPLFYWASRIGRNAG